MENFISLEKCEQLRNESEKILEKYDLEDVKKLSVFAANNSETEVNNERFF